MVVEVTRGERVESTHRIAACVCDPDGAVAFAAGSIDVPVFTRSAAKPFIAAAAVRAGVVERFGLAPEEIAIMCGSHTGEPAHLAAVGSILAKIGAEPSALQCGGNPPLANNCSGKHAGILAFARLLGAPLAGYLDAGHPAQRAILDFCERIFGEPLRGDRLGVDGCGIPNFAVPLRTGARAFARFGRSADGVDGAALARVRSAMLEHPWFVAGTARFDTDLMQAAGGAAVAKLGAEGIQGVAAPAAGLGVFVKVEDGSRRAGAPATLEILRVLGILDAPILAALAEHARPPVRNVAGRVVGEIRIHSPDRSPGATLPGSMESELS